MPSTENLGGNKAGINKKHQEFSYLNADVYYNGDPYGYLVADFIAFCQTNKKPVKLDKYKLCGLFTLFPILLQLDRFFLLVIVVSPF